MKFIERIKTGELPFSILCMQSNTVPVLFPKGMCITNNHDYIHPNIIPKNLNLKNMGLTGQLPECFQYIMSDICLYGNTFTGKNINIFNFMFLNGFDFV
jgi:hypothetical protein